MNTSQSTNNRSNRASRAGRVRMAAVGASMFAGTALAFVSVAPSAFADTSGATAQAAVLAPLNLPVVDSGTETASSAGPNVGTPDPPLSILGNQTTITADALQQTAVAVDGTSSACAGLLGNGATIQVGETNICSLSTGGETGGVTIGGIGPTSEVLNATAIVETCSDSSTGSPIASAQLVDATLAGVAIPANPAPNTNLLDLNLVYLNTQSTSDGEITATALSIPLLGLTIGKVTCGPDAVTDVSSAVPVKSLPIAGGTAAVIGAGVFFWYRRRTNTVAIDG